MYWKGLGILVVGLCGFMLHQLDKAEKISVYNNCLKGYNYQDLDKRISRLGHAASIQRLEHRKSQVKQSCNQRKQEHTSI